MEHLMLDIETLGTDPGSVILSIAAVEFEIGTGETGREFFYKIALEDSVEKGFKIDPATLRWWLEQNPDVLKKNIEISKNELTNSTVDKVMQELMNIFKYCLPHNVKVWGNSNRFDLGLLIPYIEAAEHKIPWKYSSERDVRTLVALNPTIKETTIINAKENKLDLHNPIVDCKVQIEYCHKIYNSLKR